MTMATEPADDTALAEEIFSSDREDRGGKEPSPYTERDEGPTRDERGRFSARSTEPTEAQQPPTAQQAIDGQDAEGKEVEAEPPPEQNGQHHVPLNELKAERKRRQDMERQFQELQQQNTQLLQLMNQRLQSPQASQAHQMQPEQVQIPDPIVDPEGYINHHFTEFKAQQRSDMLDLYEERVREKHGDEKVNAALQLAQQTGVIQQIIQTKDPWSALMKWSAAYSVRQTIGDDLEAYNKRIADEAVAKALEGLKQGSVDGGALPTQPRFPGSLAAATATGKQGATLTEAGIAEDVFGSGRRRGAS